MLGITDQGLVLLIALIVGSVLAIIFIAFFISQGEGGFIWQAIKAMIYDIFYLMFGPATTI